MQVQNLAWQWGSQSYSCVVVPLICNPLTVAIALFADCYQKLRSTFSGITSSTPPFAVAV